jgi:hypothetical protein
MKYFRMVHKRGRPQQLVRKDVMPKPHPFHALEQPIKADYRGNPTLECPCGSNLLISCAVWDPETRLPGLIMLDGMCANCGALLTLPTPIDEELEKEYWV